MLLATSEWLRFQPTWRANSWRRSFTIRPPSPTKVKRRNVNLAMSVVRSVLLRYYFLEFRYVMYRPTVDVSNCVFGKRGVMLQRVARLHTTVQFASEFALLIFHEFIFNL